MSNPIDEIIRQAMQRGEFDNLPNRGRKLNLDDYFELPEEVRIGYTLLKDANFVPEEVALLREIGELEGSLKTAQGKEEKEKIRRSIREKRLNYDLLMEVRKKRK